ncbi:serine hydrolase domain-containing protein [Halorarius litoreus]|uniref:serine hydrolase domain-containing protein n=1 Tax=Halorarius litoreus TaxID=2962676 RepID=UPI0020CE1C59|nr:serine hydrolase domain-containing protein [Halorarius litoreus]
MPVVDGTVDDGFEPVVAAFAENFRSRNELGAACAVYHHGEKVVDIWGGYRDLAAESPWEADTMVHVISGTKGMTAAAIALAHSRGLFDLDDRIADHWPAFGQHGKTEITVEQLLSHQAGLAALDHRLTPEEIADTEHLSDLLAAKEPDWIPGTRHGYHAFSLGWYASELLRHIDGRTLGQYFAEEVAAPLDLEFSVGLPEDTPADRVAELDKFRPVTLLRNLDTMPPRFVLALLYPRSITSRALNCLDATPPGDPTAPGFRSVEIPSANGVGTVRSMAKLYGDLSMGAPQLGLDERTMDALTTVPAPPTGGLKDLVIKIETRYGMGYSKPHDNFQFGRSDRAFGTPGAGGMFAFADPDEALGFAYAPNRFGVHLKDDPREVAVRDAVYQCLG